MLFNCEGGIEFKKCTDLVITDPYYIFNNDEWLNSEFLKENTLFTQSNEGDGIFDIYDVYEGKEDKKGTFTIDTAQMCVITKDKLLEFNPNFFNEHPKYTYMEIPKFRGKMFKYMNEEIINKELDITFTNHMLVFKGCSNRKRIEYETVF